MFDLFSSELPLVVRFAIAFVVVLLLFVAAAWVVKRLGGAKLAGGSAAGAGRGRQPRLGVLDVLAIDSRRRLVIVRRDNVEHLLMIGGPNDVVVESSIVRVPFAGREAPAVELGRPQEAGRAPMPVPIAVAGQGAAARPQRPPQPPVHVPDPAELGAMMRGQTPTIRPAPEPPAAPPAAARPAPRPPVVEAPPPEPVEELPRPAARQAQPPMPRAATRPLSSPVAREQAPPPRTPAPRVEPAPQPNNPRPRSGRSEPAPPAAAAPGADPLFTDIAQRLEQALRRPTPAPPQGRPASGGRSGQSNSGAEPSGEGRQPAERTPQGKPSQQGSASRDSLEEEMASLLGRETGRDGGRNR